MLHPVPVSELATFWPWVREGLQKIIDKCDDDWLPEDVYYEIKSGASHLYLIRDPNGDNIGFAVFQRWDKYHAGPRLFIRALWAEPRQLVKHRKQFYEELHRLKRECGCVKLRTSSPRRWDLDGWELQQFIYEM